MPDAFVMALAGGICIGLATVFLMITLGRIGGISGIVFSAAKNHVENLWAILFIAGLVLGAFLFHVNSDRPIPAFDVPMPLLLSLIHI